VWFRTAKKQSQSKPNSVIWQKIKNENEPIVSYALMLIRLMLFCDLKKQSQFVPGLMGATSYAKGDYDEIPLCGAQENKAKQTQFQLAPCTAVG